MRLWLIMLAWQTLDTAYSHGLPRLYWSFEVVEGPILYCLSSISHSCQRSNNTVFDIHCPKSISGSEFQLSKSRSSELYWEQALSVPTPLNANKRHLSMPTWRALPAMVPFRKTMPLTLALACTNVDVYVSLWLAEMLSFSHTSLTQNVTQKERLLKKYRLCGCSRMFQNG